MEKDKNNFIFNNDELATLNKPNQLITARNKEEFEQMIMAIARSKRDIVWWAENFFRIVSLNTGLSIIKLYDKQKQMLRHLVENDRNIVLSSRQTGKCVQYDSYVKIRNKKTGQIETIEIGKLFDRFVNP